MNRETQNNPTDTNPFKAITPSHGALIAVATLPAAALLILGGIMILLAALRGGFPAFWTAQVLYSMLITVTATLAGALTLAITWKYWPEFVPQGILAAMAMRLTLTLAGLITFSRFWGIASVEFFLCTAGFYLLGLIIETVIAVKLIRMGQT